MQFKRKIYCIDWKLLLLQLIPTALRLPGLKALKTALLSPLGFLYAKFWNYKLEVEYRLTITAQVVYLQRFLNDNYDFDKRRIRVVDPVFFDTADLYLIDEDRELVMPLASEEVEEGPESFYTLSETEAQGDDFIIKLPAGLEVNIERITAQLNSLKLPTRRYKITHE